MCDFMCTVLNVLAQCLHFNTRSAKALSFDLKCNVSYFTDLPYWHLK